MDPTRLRKALEDGDVLLGLLNNYPSAAIIESIGALWDFVWIDGQHGQFSYDSALAAVRMADLAGVDSVLRVPGHEDGVIGLYADMFPSALMVPMVNNAEDAAAVVSASRFPPLGNRSYGGRRPIDVVDRNYYQNHEPLLVVQIETPQAVDNAADIAATEGVDVVFLGTDDLKIQMGLPVNTPTLESKPILDALAHVAKVAKDAGKAAGCVAPHPDLFKRSVELGYQLVMGGSDRAFLCDASREQVQTLRKTLE